MEYKRGDTVDFNDWTSGKKKSGRVVDQVLMTDTYWVKVKEGFSYLNTLEINGRVAKFINQFSPTIDYYVLGKEIVGLTPEKTLDR